MRDPALEDAEIGLDKTIERLGIEDHVGREANGDHADQRHKSHGIFADMTKPEPERNEDQ